MRQANDNFFSFQTLVVWLSLYDFLIVFYVLNRKSPHLVTLEVSQSFFWCFLYIDSIEVYVL